MSDQKNITTSEKESDNSKRYINESFANKDITEAQHEIRKMNLRMGEGVQDTDLKKLSLNNTDPFPDDQSKKLSQ